AALQGPEIFDAAVVVTRYFGGTLLGTGGLSRAYAQTASGAVQNAGFAVMTECGIFEIRCAYGLYDSLVFLLGSAGVKIIGTDYAEIIRITAKCRSTEFGAVKELLAEKTSGKVEPVLLRNVFEPF
ncbi:MAG: YigZ family protein, partial [Firmicutes bacterium]|nr:YigZ family protein [Bacillota bacterium]